MNIKQDRNITIPAERQKQILEYIDKHGCAQIKELALYHQVSEATIRRDLDELDRTGQIERTHGGAITTNRSTSFERIHSEKMNLMIDEKRRIAKKASELIKDGDTILLDSGTTNYFISQTLSSFKNITVITYDLHIANTVILHPTSTLIVTGGIRRDEYNVLLGSITEAFISDLRVNKVFLGADAVDLEFGISNANLIEAKIKKLIIQAGKKVYLVCDHSKFGRTALAKICNLTEVDTVITDDGIAENIVHYLKTNNVELIRV